jgi:hypothetical protein
LGKVRRIKTKEGKHNEAVINSDRSREQNRNHHHAAGEATSVKIHRQNPSDRNHGRIANKRGIVCSAASLLHRERFFLPTNAIECR